MHARAKISATFWVVATALVTTLALAIIQRWRYEIEVYQVTGLGMLLALVWRFWAVRRLNTQQELNADSRVAELQREATLLDQPVRIEGMGPTLWLMIGMAFTALLFMIVSREGVQPAGYGLLPWSVVFGIECHTRENKHLSGTVLNLYVPDLKQHLHSAHPFIRFFRAFPVRAAEYVDVITIPLRKPSELPGVIERLCRNVWRDATGRTPVWSIGAPISRLQLEQMIADTDRWAQAASRSNEALEQHRMEMEILRRQAQVADEKHLSQRAWTRIWNVPGAFAIALIAGQVPFSRLVGFVPTDAWSTQALTIAAVVIVMVWALVIGHARNVFGSAFTRKRLIQVLVTLGLTSILVLPLTWFLITDVGGAMAAYGGGGPNEEITVIAAKKEVTTRRGCSYVLSHPGLGKRLCLVYSEFVSYPNQVPVVLSIRRNALGYKVYAQKIVLPRTAFGMGQSKSSAETGPPRSCGGPVR